MCKHGKGEVKVDGHNAGHTTPPCAVPSLNRCSVTSLYPSVYGYMGIFIVVLTDENKSLLSLVYRCEQWA